MKNLTKGISIALILFFFISQIAFTQIQSTSLGGDWNDINTWVGSSIPGSTDNVVINGPVNCNTGPQCYNLTINISGVIQNDYYSGDLDVFGDIINNGTIQNYSSTMYMYLYGNVTNNGTWINSYTYLEGTNDQTITCFGGHAFGGYQLINNKTGGEVYFNAAVNFVNNELHFNNHIANILPNTIMDFDNSTVHYCSFIGDGSTSIIQGTGSLGTAPYFNYVSFTDLTLDGEINVYNGCSTNGTVYNNGILQNEYYTCFLAVNGHFINNGTLRNYSSYLILQVYGDFTNNNVVDNHALDFHGSAIHDISLAPGKTFSPTYWTSFKSGGWFDALTDIYFDNVNINMGEDSLYVPDNAVVTVNDGQYINGGILAHESTKAGTFTYHSENTAITQNIDMTNATLTGHFLCDNNNNFYGTTVNDALFENNYYTFYVNLYDHFINNGTIQNYSSHLFLNIHGDFTNNGTIENNAMDFHGLTDQMISLQSGITFSPTYFTSLKPSGNIVALTDLYFDHVVVNFENDILYLQDGGLISLTGGRLHKADLRDLNNTSGYLNLHMTGDAYIDYSTVYNPEILGQADIGHANIFIGEILVTDTVRNDYYSYTLDIDGNVINNGIIKDYSSGLTVNINGNVTNNGTWSCVSTFFNGTTDQYITCLNDAGFSGYHMFNTNTTANIVIQDNVYLQNSILKGEGNNFLIPVNSTLRLHDAYITNSFIYGVGESSVLFGEGTTPVDGPYIEYTTVENLSFDGEWGIGNPVIMNGSITNNGVMQNNYYTYSPEVYADFINNGTIKSYSNYCIMKMYGNFTNNGIWEGHAIDLYGSADQEVTLADGEVFSPTYVTSFKPTGYIIANTDLSFYNTNINLEHDTLIMPDNSTLSIDGYYLYRSNIMAETDKFNLFMTNDAYVHECSIGDVDLYGEIDLKNTDFNGTTTNYGLMMNDYYTYTINYFGDLINNGTIQNDYNAFIISAHANITNNGTWANYYTQMVGTTDQYVYLKNEHWIAGQMRFVSDVLATPYQWYWNNWAIQNPPYPDPPIISGETSSTLTWISPVTDGWAGTYKCHAGSNWSRNIYIEEQTSLRLDVTAMFEGPFNGTDMTPDLNPILPMGQPYDTYPWEYDGAEAVSILPNADIVDWLLVEIRDASSASSATSATSLGGQAAFIQRDGQIVGLDGNPVLSFDLQITQNLFVVLWHRNHLPVLSNYAVIPTNGIHTYDFTTAASQAYGNNQNDLGGGVFGMIGGDANADGTINQFDGTEVWYLQVGRTGYLQGDANMDIQVNNEDKNDVWLLNNGKSEILPD